MLKDEKCIMQILIGNKAGVAMLMSDKVDCGETCFYNIFLASLLKTPSCPSLLCPVFLLEKQSQ